MTETRRVTIEVCVEDPAGVRVAHAAGADRVELCCALPEGGLTPARAPLEAAVALRLLPVVVLVRPRAGDFVYSEEEGALLEREVEHARELGAAGVALGALTPEGTLDGRLLARLVRRAGPLPVTVHRAFDQVSDAARELQRLLDLGVARVLTSGGAPTALEGRARLREHVRAAGTRLEVVAAGSVRAESVGELLAASGVSAVHLAARGLRPSAMLARAERAQLAPAGLAELDVRTTDATVLSALVATVRAHERTRTPAPQ